MDQFYSLLLIFLELTFIFVGMAMLHSQRKTIGSTPFYMAMGLLFVMSQFVSAVDFRVALWGAFEFKLGPVALFLPYLAAMLLVYVTEGTLATQRLILGSLALYGLFLYLAEITRLQCNWLGFSIVGSQTAEALDLMLKQSLRSMGALVFSQLVALFLLPIIYTRLQELKFGSFNGVLISLITTQLVDLIIYISIVYWRHENWLEVLSGALLARAVASLWISLLMTIYLSKIESEKREIRSGALDIVFAFFGGYSRSIMLEKNLREWENRYKVILENASEMVVLLSLGGDVMDTNSAAEKILYDRAGLDRKKCRLTAHLMSEDGKPMDETLLRRIGGNAPFSFHTVLPDAGGGKIHLACTLSPLQMLDQNVLALIGRDVTEENQLAEEKERLSLELAHAQRLESLGQLAGGVAHDFNNHLHAILGHLDLLHMLHDFSGEPEVARHLDKVGEIAEQSGKLTSQLLGFARRGKYREETIDLCSVIEQSLDMIPPQRASEIETRFSAARRPLPVRGDRVQLQQIFVNLIINAIDAVQDSEPPRRIEISCGRLDTLPTIPTPPASFAMPDTADYVYAAVKDNGCGMDELTQQRVFEPFFTTKPVGQGTGMGLSMVYGAITNHHGYVQLESEPGQGSVFWIVLPLCRKTADAAAQ